MDNTEVIIARDEVKGHVEKGSDTLPLREYVRKVLDNYFSHLDGHKPAQLYDMVLEEVELPLLEAVMKYTRGNQCQAAIVLGLSRGTLRKKLKTYSLL
jgi:Fis family transcriptional regulator